MLERLAENDDTFLEQYLGGEYTETDIRSAIRRATLARRVTPVLSGSALGQLLGQRRHSCELAFAVCPGGGY